MTDLNPTQNHSIIILNLYPYRSFLVQPLRNLCEQWFVSKTNFQPGYNIDDAFSYCIIRAFSDVAGVQVYNWSQNFGMNDLYKIFYEDHLSHTYQRCMQMALDGYRLKFHSSETVKAISTVDELILVRYFPQR